MCSENKDKETKIFDVSLQMRNLEIKLFWQRSLFFWGFIATAFAGLATFSKPTNNNPALSLIISLFGLVCSFCWLLTNLGNKYWQEYWEKQVEDIEDNPEESLFRRVLPIQPKGCLFSARKFSPSKLTIALSYYVTFIWIGLTLYNVFKLSVIRHFFKLEFNTTVPLKDVLLFIFVLLTTIWLVVIFCCTRTTERDNQRENKKKKIQKE